MSIGSGPREDLGSHESGNNYMRKYVYLDVETALRLLVGMYEMSYNGLRTLHF